jgi:hypothetical protein
MFVKGVGCHGDRIMRCSSAMRSESKLRTTPPKAAKEITGRPQDIPATQKLAPNRVITTKETGDRHVKQIPMVQSQHTLSVVRRLSPPKRQSRFPVEADLYVACVKHASCTAGGV